MDMINEFGVTGEVMYKSWERKYEKIVQDVRFGGANQEDALMPLKIEINDEVNKRNEKSEKWKKCGIVMIVICIVLVFLSAMYSNVTELFLFTALLTIVPFKMKANNEKVVYAAIEFDKKYFSGEIFYRRKNG